MEFIFIDGEKICVYKDGDIKEYESGFIEKYRASMLQSAKNSEWKKKSRTEMMLNEDFYFEDDREFLTKINSAWLTENENELVYSFTVNETSGIYEKDLADEKKIESHIISSSELEFSSLNYLESGMLVSIKKGEVTADIAVFSKDRSDYKCVTGGDSLDENPYLHTDGKIYFNSYGVARDEVGNFLGYGKSEIYSLDLKTMKIEEELSSEKYSLVKPLRTEKGFYVIKKPIEEKEKTNPFIDVLMIPVRIVQAIVGFVSLFVNMFSGKPLVSEGGRQSNGYSMAKNFKTDEKRLYVLNNLIRVDEEMKKNRKDDYPGFIPRSWRLSCVEIDEDGEYHARSYGFGVADYCILETGELIATNGKNVLQIIDNDDNTYSVKRLVETDCCLKVMPIKKFNANNPDDIFSTL